MATPSAEESDRFAAPMQEPISLQVDMNALVSSRTKAVEDEEDGPRSHMEKWLTKGREISRELKPTQFSVRADICFKTKRV